MMKALGLNSGVFWTAWFIENMAIYSISSVLLTLIMKYGGMLYYAETFPIFSLFNAFESATYSYVKEVGEMPSVVR